MIDQRAKSDNDQKGFTLLEVLVALAILSISLGILLPVFSATLQRQGELADQRTANLLAQSKLDALGSEIGLADGSSDGSFDNGFKWHIDIAPYDFDRTSILMIPKLVTLTVQWPARNGPRSLVVKTIRLVGRE